MKQSSIVMAALLGAAIAAPAGDLVTKLPEMQTFDTWKLYSGYININDNMALHYMFAESQNAPTTDPLVLWYNGGPGCSSMLGFTQEHGPWVMEDEATTFHKNTWSWNLEANMLYIEQPAGVGYSICRD